MEGLEWGHLYIIYNIPTHHKYHVDCSQFNKNTIQYIDMEFKVHTYDMKICAVCGCRFHKAINKYAWKYFHHHFLGK